MKPKGTATALGAAATAAGGATGTSNIESSWSKSLKVLAALVSLLA